MVLSEVYLRQVSIIAIVEDNHLLTEQLLESMMACGEINMVFCAGDGNEVLQKLATCHKLHDVILMEIECRA